MLKSETISLIYTSENPISPKKILFQTAFVVAINYDNVNEKLRRTLSKKKEHKIEYYKSDR